MTAGSPGDIFDDGADFGPITWSSPQLTRAAGTQPITWAEAGHTQSWPDDSTRVIITHRAKPAGASEADEIYLHP
jgi:hypothetical protein